MRSKRLQTIALLAVSLAIALFAAEGTLRLIGYSNPSFTIRDPVLGFALRPGAEGWWTREGRAYVKISLDGMRDSDHSLEKPPRTVRVAVLGDSYVEGRQLPTENLFWKILEKDLAGCAPDNETVEALNFGVGGFGTAQELLLLRTKVWKYQPDIVVLAFFTGNDVANNSKILNQHKFLPFFTLQDNELLLDSSYLESGAFDEESRWLLRLARQYVNDIRLLQLINDVRFRWLIQSPTALQRNRAGPAAEVGLDNAIYAPPNSDAWNEAWRVTEALIQTMAEEVRAAGARFLLVTLSNAVQVHPDPTERQILMEQLAIDDLFYPDRRIFKFARNAGIDVLILAPEFQQWAQEHHTCIHGFPNSGLCQGHWNEHGHRLAAERIAQKICQDFFHGASESHLEPEQVDTMQ